MDDRVKTPQMVVDERAGVAEPVAPSWGPKVLNRHQRRMWRAKERAKAKAARRGARVR